MLSVFNVTDFVFVTFLTVDNLFYIFFAKETVEGYDFMCRKQIS